MRGWLRGLAATALLLAGAFLLLAGPRLPGLAFTTTIAGAQPRAGLAYVAPLGDPSLSEADGPLAAHLFQQTGTPGMACRWLGPALAPAACAGAWLPLGPGSAQHDEVEALGGGRYSIWRGSLIFSAPDGGDARAGHYLLLVERGLAPGLAGLGCLGLGAMLLRRLLARARALPRLLVQPGRRREAGVLLLLAAVLLGLHGARLPGIAQVFPLRDVAPHEGLGFAARLPDPAMGEAQQALEAHLYRQQAMPGLGCRLLGPAAPLGACGAAWQEVGIPHAEHALIAAEGGGRFSLWNGWILLSSPDASDPRASTWWVVVESPGRAAALALAAGLAGLAMLLPPGWPWRRRVGALVLGLCLGGLALLARQPMATMPLALGGLLLAALTALPQTRPGRLGGPGLALLAGFTLTCLGLGRFYAAQDLIRTGAPTGGEPAAILPRLAAAQSAAPILLFIGSSLTSHAIDPQTLEQALAEAGQPRHVVGLSWGGMSPVERHHHLARYLATARQIPQEAVLEIAYYYERIPGPLEFIEVNRYSPRVIAMADWSSIGWGLRWLWQEDRRSLAVRVDSGVHLLAQGLLHAAQVGMLAQGRPFDPSTPAWVEEPCPPAGSTMPEEAPDVQAGQYGRWPREPQPEELWPGPWGESILAEQMAMLRAAGVRRIGFYAPPSRLPHQNTYMRNFCTSHPGTDCLLPPQDPSSALAAALAQPAAWRDRNHLCRPGRQPYSAWLGHALATTWRGGR